MNLELKVFSLTNHAKVHIYTSEAKWRPVIQSYIADDQLPIRFGGSCVALPLFYEMVNDLS